MEESPYKVTGTTYIRNVNSLRVNGIQPQPGHLHCGCPEDPVLFAFYLWKQTKITSPLSNVTEGWGDQQLDPWARMLMATAWQEWTGLTIDQMYREDKSGTEAEIERLKYQIEVFQESLAKAEEKLGRNERR